MATTLRSPYVVSSRRPTPDVPNVSLHEHLLRHAEESHEAPAVIDAASGRSLAYGALATLGARAAGGLARRGIGPGDIVCLHAPNVPEWALAMLAVLRRGATVMAASPLATPAELARELRLTEAKAIVTAPPFLAAAGEAAASAGVPELILLDGAQGAQSFAALLEADPAPAQPVDPASDVAAMLWSSGTTGAPKAVELTHRNLVAALAQFETPVRLEPRHRLLGLAPFFHSLGFVTILCNALAQGAAVVSMPRFDLEAMLRALEEHHVSHVIVPPPIGLALSRHPLVDGFDLSSVEVLGMGAAPVSAELERACAARLGCLVGQGYGMTESSAALAVFPAEAPERGRPGSAGELLGGTEAIVVDPATGAAVAPGAVGEIRIRGPQVMRGYRGNPEATAATITPDGWLCTGDLGRVGADGVVEVTDRLKELIKYKGHQVAPAELEALIATHPAVADVAVVGSPDEEAGELPKAFVVAAGALDPGELIDWVAQRVAPYERVRLVELIDEVPKSPTGKVLRRVLVERERR
jgi:acyl-CoA synthetase (AMP-forming)/AMP-acid ligase II